MPVSVGPRQIAGHALDSNSKVGVCLSAIRDYEPQFAFTDLMKTCRYWQPQPVAGWTPPPGQTLPPLDTEGWPLSITPGEPVGTVCCWDMGNKHPMGSYKVTYDGGGTIVWVHGATVTSAGPGYYNIEIVGNGLWFKITATNPNDHMRNIKILPVGQTGPWYQPFFDRLKYFGVLRFTTWNELYNAASTDWVDRVQPDYFTQTTNLGVAWEYCIQLCNDAHRDCYISVPYTYTDAAIVSLATLFRDTLDDSLKLYVEYSNETWNGIFPALNYCSAQGVLRGYGGTSFDSAMRFHGARTAEIGGIFETVYGSELSARVVRVMGTWSASPATALTSLEWTDGGSYSGAAYTHCDAVAIAPYSDPGSGAANVAAAISQYDAATISTMANAATHKAQADAKSLDLICYEAGQHSTSGEQVYNDTNRDPLMEGVYDDYLDTWFTTVGGGVTCLFDLCEKMQDMKGNARWGLLEYMDQDATLAPKWRSAITWRA